MTFFLSALLFWRLVDHRDFFDLSERQVRLPFHFVAGADCILDISTGSDRYCGTERVWP